MKSKLLELLKTNRFNLKDKEAGLFKGQAGVCLIVYLLSNDLHDYKAKLLADTLLKNILDNTSTYSTLTLDKGVVGIGLVINILISMGFVEGNADEMLEDVDAMIYKKVNDQRLPINVDFCSGEIGYLLYVVNRLMTHKKDDSELQYQLNIGSLRTIINRLDKEMPSVLKRMSEDMYVSLLWNAPITFFILRQVLSLKLYSEKIKKTIDSWANYICATLPMLHANRLYLATSLAYLNTSLDNDRIAAYITTLILSIDIEKITKEMNATIMDGNEGYAFLVALLWNAEHILPNTTFNNQLRHLRRHINDVYMPECQKHLDGKRGLDIDLIQGIGGIELLNYLFPKAFVTE